MANLDGRRPDRNAFCNAWLRRCPDIATQGLPLVDEEGLNMAG